MVKYVSDEVDRLKGMFQEREDQLTDERDRAKDSCTAMSKKIDSLNEAVQSSQAKAGSLAAELEVLPYPL